MRFLLLVFFLLSCGEDSKDGKAPLAQAGLFLTTTDSSYTSSKLWLLPEGEVEPVAVVSGQAGDHLLIQDEESLLMINRSADQQSILEFDLSQEEIKIASEVSLSGFGARDPAGVVVLNDSNLLFAAQESGELVVVDRKSGKALSKLDYNFDLPGGVEFRPGAINSFLNNGRRYILVIHYGYALDNSAVVANESQRAFIFEETSPGEIKPVDMNGSTTDKLEGLPLKSTSPSITFDGGQVVIAGFCSKYVLNCTPGLERLVVSDGMFSVEEIKTSLLVDFEGNGPLFYDSKVSGLITSVIEKNGTKNVVSLDFTSGEKKAIHEFPEYSSGCCALFGDYSYLYVGDRRGEKDESGVITLYSNGKRSGSIAVDGIPYQGVYVN